MLIIHHKIKSVTLEILLGFPYVTDLSHIFIQQPSLQKTLKKGNHHSDLCQISSGLFSLWKIETKPKRGKRG